MATEELIEKNKKFNSMTVDEKRIELCRQIKNAVALEIHSNVCYLLNFCELPQDKATELSEHYNKINHIINNWLKELAE